MGDVGLEFFACRFTVLDKLLALGHLPLQVVEDLELFVQGYQGVKLMLKLNVLLLQRQLELVFLALVEHGRGEFSCDRSRGLPDDGLSAIIVRGSSDCSCAILGRARPRTGLRRCLSLHSNKNNGYSCMWTK